MNVSKFQEPKKDDRKMRSVTAALSATGAAAGAGGLAYAAHDMARSVKAGKKVPWKTKALIPLEVAGLGGEVLATHILHGDAKRAGAVKKSDRAKTAVAAGGITAGVASGVPAGSAAVALNRRSRLVSEASHHARQDRYYMMRADTVDTRNPLSSEAMGRSLQLKNEALIARAKENHARMQATKAGRRAATAGGIAGAGLVAGLAGALYLDNRNTRKDVRKDAPMQVDPRNGYGRRITEGVVVKAMFKPEEGRATVLIPGHGLANGTLRPVRSTAGHRVRSTVGGAAIGGVVGSTTMPVAGLVGPAAGAVAGGAAGYLGSRWQQQFQMDQPAKRKKKAKKKVAKAGPSYFDPESDRQRRTGMYAGAAAGGSVAAGMHAAQSGKFKLVSGPKRVGLKATKGGLVSAAAAAGLGAVATGVYRRGVSRRNQPWS